MPTDLLESRTGRANADRVNPGADRPADDPRPGPHMQADGDGAAHAGTSARLGLVWPLLRLTMAFTFLWAFADKLLALGFSTGRDDTGTAHVFGPSAWIHGGSPTKGYMSFAAEGPFAGLAHHLAGVPIIDWLFMLGLLGVGLALALGIGMRIAAVAGSLLLLAIRAVAPLPENNPVVDEHIIYSLLLFGLVAVRAGDRWGLGRRWRASRLVARFPVIA